MTDTEQRLAREWYGNHRLHVNAMLRERGPEAEPTGSDAGRPDLWTAMHWRWFMVGEVAKQIGVKV